MPLDSSQSTLTKSVNRIKPKKWSQDEIQLLKRAVELFGLKLVKCSQIEMLTSVLKDGNVQLDGEADKKIFGQKRRINNQLTQRTGLVKYWLKSKKL